MEVGKNFITSEEFERYYPKMYKKFHKIKSKKSDKKIKKIKTKKIQKTKIKKQKPQKINKIKPEKIKKQKPEKINKIKQEKMKNPKALKPPKPLNLPRTTHEQREANNKGKMLQQLLFINQRMETMDRDKEKYALVDFIKKLEKKQMAFTIVKIGERKKVTITVNDRYETQCSCMDWKIRCVQFSVPCKHIYYLLTKILTYELFDYYDNMIMQPDTFNILVRNRLNFGVRFEINKNEDALADSTCLICYNGFDKNHQENEHLKCPDCNNFFHNDCMHSWLENSKNRNCPVCRSEKWAVLFKKN